MELLPTVILVKLQELCVKVNFRASPKGVLVPCSLSQIHPFSLQTVQQEK